MLRVALVLVLSALLVPFPPVQAQAAVGGLVYYFDSMPEAGLGDAKLVLEPPSSEDQTVSCVGDCSEPLTITATSDPTPALAKVDGKAEAVVWFKSWNNAPAPGTKVDVVIKAGETELASGSATQDILNGAIVEYRFQMDYKGSSLAAGTVLTMAVTVALSSCNCYVGTAYPRGVSADHPWSMALPLKAAAAEAAGVSTQFAVLEGPSVNLTKAYPDAATERVQYNWTSALVAPAIGLTIQREAGNATVVILDGSNATVFEAATNGAPATASASPMAKAGAWRIVLNTTAFKGNITLTVAAVGTQASSGASTSTSASSPGGAGGSDATAASNAASGAASTSASSSSSAKKGTPGFEPALLLVAFAVALVSLRRRA